MKTRPVITAVTLTATMLLSASPAMAADNPQNLSAYTAGTDDKGFTNPTEKPGSLADAKAALKKAKDDPEADARNIFNSVKNADGVDLPGGEKTQGDVPAGIVEQNKEILKKASESDANTMAWYIQRVGARHIGTPYSWGGGDLNGPTKGSKFAAQAAEEAGDPDAMAGKNYEREGFDCARFVANTLWKAAGIALPPGTYAQEEVLAQHKDVKKLGEGKEVWKELQPGDIVFLNDRSHVGIVTSYPTNFEGVGHYSISILEAAPIVRGDVVRNSSIPVNDPGTEEFVSEAPDHIDPSVNYQKNKGEESIRSVGRTEIDSAYRISVNGETGDQAPSWYPVDVNGQERPSSYDEHGEYGNDATEKHAVPGN